MMGGDFNAHISAPHTSWVIINGQPEPPGPLGPFFTYDGGDYFDGDHSKKYVRANGLFSPASRSPSQQGEEVRASRETATPGR